MEIKKRKKTMYFKKLSLSCLFLSCLFLQGCLSTSLWDYAKIQDGQKTKVVISDQIQHVGQATTNFQNQEKPVILVGQKNNYMVNNPDQLDLKLLNENLKPFLAAPAHSCCYDQYKLSHDNIYKYELAGKPQQKSQLNVPFYLYYYKRKNDMRPEETDFLETHKFSCSSPTSNHFTGEDRECILRLGNQFTILPKTTMLPELTLIDMPAFQFNVSYKDNVIEYQKSPLLIFLPVTAAVDIATTPVTIPLVLYLLISTEGSFLGGA